MKFIKRHHVLETTAVDITIAFIYDNNSQEILVMKREALPDFLKELAEIMKGEK